MSSKGLLNAQGYFEEQGNIIQENITINNKILKKSTDYKYNVIKQVDIPKYKTKHVW